MTPDDWNVYLGFFAGGLLVGTVSGWLGTVAAWIRERG